MEATLRTEARSNPQPPCRTTIPGDHAGDATDATPAQFSDRSPAFAHRVLFSLKRIRNCCGNFDHVVPMPITEKAPNLSLQEAMPDSERILRDRRTRGLTGPIPPVRRQIPNQSKVRHTKQSQLSIDPPLHEQNIARNFFRSP